MCCVTAEQPNARTVTRVLKRIVSTPSPSGFEQPVAQLYRDYVTPFADRVTTDIMGNVMAIINPDAPMRVMYAGHMDEIGFIVHYIDDDGFLFFSPIGGTDTATEIGQRVLVHGGESVPGVVGRKAIQTFGIVSVPLRYMHTPSEVMCLTNVEATIDLVCEYCRRIRPDTDFTPW